MDWSTPILICAGPKGSMTLNLLVPVRPPPRILHVRYGLCGGLIGRKYGLSDPWLSKK